MKRISARIEENDDGTFSVECSARGDGMCMPMGKTMRYSASTLADAVSKIEESKKEIENSKDEDKPKVKDKVKAFLETSDDDED
jgi:hypothetical protein